MSGVEGTESGLDQNSEVSSTKPELSETNGPSCFQKGDVPALNRSPSVKFGSSPFMSAQKNHFALRSSVLSPSVLGGKVSGDSGRSISFVLNPPRLSSPFAKTEEKTDKEEETEEKEPAEAIEDNKDNVTTPTKSKVEAAGATTPLRSSVAFVPLKTESRQSECGCPMGPSPSPSLGFVFGQNLHERVEAAPLPTDNGSSPKEPEKPAGPVNESEPKTNGTTSEMLFTAGVKKETPDKNADSGGKTLIEAAREYEESRAIKRKYEAVTIVTGEEEESNVLQMNCKLFAFDKCTCSWVERGRGTLRLNDLPTNPPQSRLIVRVVGSLRLVLNTKIWAGMSVGRASQKSLRITAMDSSQVVRVFLIMASPKETDQLQKALEWRLNSLKKSTTSASTATATEHEADDSKKCRRQ